MGLSVQAVPELHVPILTDDSKKNGCSHFLRFLVLIPNLMPNMKTLISHYLEILIVKRSVHF